MYDVNLTGIYLVSVMLAIILAQLGVFHRTILRSELILYLPPLPPAVVSRAVFVRFVRSCFCFFSPVFLPFFPLCPPPTVYLFALILFLGLCVCLFVM